MKPHSIFTHNPPAKLRSPFSSTESRFPVRFSLYDNGMKALAILIAFSITFASSATFAALGQGVDSIEKDRAIVSGQKALPHVHALYTVHEIPSTASTVKEYVSTEGKVFAVTWKGVTQPALGPLLGDYWNDYQKAEKNTPKVRGKRFARAVQGNKVVVETQGHMRAMRGLAYAPELVPGGVNIHELP